MQSTLWPFIDTDLAELRCEVTGGLIHLPVVALLNIITSFLLTFRRLPIYILEAFKMHVSASFVLLQCCY